MNKVYMLAPNEGWICDRIVQEFREGNPDISVNHPKDADVVWIYSDWCWAGLARTGLLCDKKIITTVHHIVPEKFGQAEKDDFARRDDITTIYHVYNSHTEDFIRQFTDKPIHLIKYWANQHAWRITGTKQEFRQKYNLPQNGYLIGSFQRDTEGKDLKSPKLEKGPDLLVDFIERKWDLWKHTDICFADESKKPHVVLAGWRRQYVIDRLEKACIPYTYFERPHLDTINELYQTLDLYPVTARYEGGPQSLIECGLLNIPVVSRHVGIAEQVLPRTAIADQVYFAYPAVPNVENWKLPFGFEPYRSLIQSL